MRIWTSSGSQAGAGRRSRTGGSLGPMAERPRAPWLSVLKWLVILGVVGAALVAATTVFVFWMYGRDPNLPDYGKLSDYHPKQLTAITDAAGRRIGEVFSERRTVVPYDKVPPILRDAFVAAEDNKFWSHGGVDYWGMFRALVKNLRAGHTKQGASTITQQVVKALLLTPERTFRRKIQEIILARRLEKSLTKEEILTLYMNQINFGHGRYGVEEAALFYFGKHVGEVNLGEAALLAGLPQSPENISPRKNPRRAKERQTYVLNQLVAMQKITVADAQKWIDAPIQIIPPPGDVVGKEWVDIAKRELLRRNNGNEAALDSLGTTVRTTLDSSMQAIAQRALQNGLRAVDKRHGIGRPLRNVKPDKLDAELTKLAKRLPHGAPVAKERYEAVVTDVFDDDDELVVDLGNWKASLVLRGEDDDRYNVRDDDDKSDAGGKSRDKTGRSEKSDKTDRSDKADKADKSTGKHAGGHRKKPSERFKQGDVVSVVIVASAAPSKADDDDEPKPKKPAAGPQLHAKHRVAFAPGPEGAVVIIDVKTRKVRALVGGYAPKAGGFNRATMAHRQPGSSFKPYVYSAAIDSGKYTPASIVNDVQESYQDIPGWKPKNYETGKNEGPVRLRYALSKSINMVSLQLAENVKPEAIVAMAKRMGITSNLNPDMSIALGSNEVTPLENTNAVATLAAGGILAEPQFIDAVDGKSVPAPAGEQVLRPEVAYVVVDMMRSVINEGTAYLAAALKIPIAGKTGTSNDSKDTWFIGLTPDYAIGVWIGYDDAHSMGREAGGTTAVPVYVEVMKQLNQPAKPFSRPAHVVEVTIDKATGLLAPDGAPKGTTMTEVFVEGTAPTAVAAMPDDVTEDNKTKGEYED